ncbi:MAG TPA: hypothetical protein PLV06_05355 [Bacteroidales bacterium]|nr:hypothetical protein [Bacteroidales bacterium]HPF01729.1 hypothetical protein [Bacteroidales bacterium]HPJ59751.1 hypothetical protein [Bacteroidales bacterium]HPR11791.1 hypothetical protein [Bacteroidales bacterium]HRW84060.1 hypothetical protein [Bacteroidales bacterium]
MTFSDFISDHGKRVTKDAFIHLVQVSRVDGKINNREMKRLHREGKKFGLTDPEIDALIESEKDHHYHAPYSLADKFDHFFNLAQIVLSDCEVHESERRMLRRFAIEVGFEDTKTDALIDLVLDGIKTKTPEEDLFKKFRKTLF